MPLRVTKTGQASENSERFSSISRQTDTGRQSRQEETSIVLTGKVGQLLNESQLPKQTIS